MVVALLESKYSVRKLQNTFSELVVLEKKKVAKYGQIIYHQVALEKEIPNIVFSCSNFRYNMRKT